MLAEIHVYIYLAQQYEQLLLQHVKLLETEKTMTQAEI